MSQLVWALGVLWVVGVTAFVSRHQRHANPRKFWFEMAELAVVLIGMYSWVTVMVWLAT